MRFCPYAQRAHLVLDAKNIPHNIVNIHLKQKPEWLTEYSRLGKVPAIGLTDVAGCPYIYESLIVADYLDEKYADEEHRQLYPIDAVAKAVDRLWIDRFAGIISAFYRFVLGPDNRPTPGAVDDLNRGLGDFESELQRRGTRFFGGADKPGMLDYMIWPWLERLPCLRLWTGEEKYEMSADQLPLLTQYQADMQLDEAVQKTYLSPENHQKFMSSHIAGNPNYELLNETA